MKVLFLDIDGVLNIANGVYERGKLYKPAVINLEYLLNKIPELKIVISSSWRHKGIDEVRNMLKESGIDPRKIIDITGNEQSEDERDHRGFQVECWLKKHPEVKNFAILDDQSDFVPLKNKLVKTNSYEGLTQRKVEELIDILNR